MSTEPHEQPSNAIESSTLLDKLIHAITLAKSQCDAPLEILADKSKLGQALREEDSRTLQWVLDEIDYLKSNENNEGRIAPKENQK